jgi:hypothetical protein
MLQSYSLDYISFQGIDQTQLNSTEAAKNKGVPIGGIIGGIIGVLILLGCCGAIGKKKYYVERRPAVVIRETTIVY